MDSDDAFELAILYSEQIHEAWSSVEVNIKSGKNGSLENGDMFIKKLQIFLYFCPVRIRGEPSVPAYYGYPEASTSVP